MNPKLWYLLPVCTFFVSTARAEIMTPSGLQPGDKFRIVFVSDGTIDATSSSLTPYDSLVGGEASAAKIDTYLSSPVTWEAMVSVADGTDAIDRLLPDHVPIYLLDGTVIASTGESLWSTTIQPLSHQINLTASGALASSNFVWTGTSPDGTGIAVGSALGGPTPVVGDSSAVTSSWTFDGSHGPTEMGRLYAFSSVLTVPAGSPAPVPEPTGLMLFLGTSLLIGVLRVAGQHAPSARP
jgi:hypothetical protein